MGIATHVNAMSEDGRQLSRHPSTPRIEIKRVANSDDSKSARKRRVSLSSLWSGRNSNSGVLNEVTELRNQIADLREQMNAMQLRLVAAETRQMQGATSPTVAAAKTEHGNPDLKTTCPDVPNGCARRSSKSLLRIPSGSRASATMQRISNRRSSAPQPFPVSKVDSDLAARLEMQRAKATQGVNVESVAPGEKKSLTSFRASAGSITTLNPASLMDRSGNMWIDGRPSQRLSARTSYGKSGRISYADSAHGGETSDEDTEDDDIHD